MAREDKVAEVNSVRDAMTGSAALLLTDYRGLTVKDLAELRAERDAFRHWFESDLALSA